MKTIKALLIILIFALPAIFAETSPASEKKISKYLTRHFPDSTEISLRKVNLKKAPPPFKKKLATLREIRTERSLYYAVDGEIWSKSTPVQFIIIFNSAAELLDVKILRAPGRFGMKIKNRKWLSKFRNIEDPQSIIYGETVDAVSGATATAIALTEGIKSLIQIARHFIRFKQNQKTKLGNTH